jgi:hypothetical protein
MTVFLTPVQVSSAVPRQIIEKEAAAYSDFFNGWQIAGC